MFKYAAYIIVRIEECIIRFSASVDLAVIILIRDEHGHVRRVQKHFLV